MEVFSGWVQGFRLTLTLTLTLTLGVLLGLIRAAVPFGQTPSWLAEPPTHRSSYVLTPQKPK